MVTTGKTRTKRNRSRSQKFKKAVLGRPQGIIQKRVQAVGPEKFGIVAIDCAKARSTWRLTDFFGNVLTQSATVEHNRNGLQLAVLTLKQAVEKHDIKDLIVAVEMTGTYHKPPMRAFRDAGYETRLVHPFASSFYRQPEHGDNKTDDNDLDAIFRATVNGFGLLEKPVDAIHQQLQILARHRRDLVKKKSKLQCQIRHHLEQGLPGFGALFDGDDLWTQITPVPLLETIAMHGGTVDVIKQAGQKGVTKWLEDAKIRFHKATIERVVVWAANAANADPMATFHTRVWISQLADWQQKKQQIHDTERDLAAVLARTPYVLLLSHPGINVVSAAELAGEMGPIENYATARAVCGRAGLFPSRYQSDEVDRTGKLTRFRNAKLRAAWLLIADNMCKCNRYWTVKAEKWKSEGHKSQDIRCRIANRMTRIVFKMVSGRELYKHPSRLDRGYVMDKLLTFLREHNTAPAVIVRDLKHAAEQLPKSGQLEEGGKLKEAALKARRSRQKGPQELGTLLVAVLARLGIAAKDDDGLKST
jgi:transposase